MGWDGTGQDSKAQVRHSVNFLLLPLLSSLFFFSLLPKKRNKAREEGGGKRGWKEMR